MSDRNWVICSPEHLADEWCLHVRSMPTIGSWVFDRRSRLRDAAFKPRYSMSMQLEAELDAALRMVRAEQDIVPFLGRWLSSGDAKFRQLPDEMLAILSNAPDFRPPVPGGRTTTLLLETEDEQAEIVVYRAITDRLYYVLAPAEALPD